MRKTLTKVKILRNTFKTVPKTLMFETIKQYKCKTLRMALTSQGVNKKIQNSAQHTNVTNFQENSYQTERETQE